MRAVHASLVAAAVVVAGSGVLHAEERPVVRVELDTRAGLSSVRFAEQVGEESRGNDLGRLVVGVIAGVGLKTNDVTIVVDGGIYRGGLAGDELAAHYYAEPESAGSPWAFTVGAAARISRRRGESLSLIGQLRAGYSRMMMSGAESAHLSSLYMDIGGGLSIPAPVAGLSGQLTVVLSGRFHRLRSLSASGLTEGSVNADDPALLTYPGLAISYDVLF